MADRIKLNMKAIIKSFFTIAGSLFGVIAIISTFFTWDEIGISTTTVKLLILLALLVISLVLAVVYILIIKRKRTIWKNGSGRITVRYGDILRLGFSKKQREDLIVVIPVNTAFDVHVDANISCTSSPLVSLNTIHGKWLSFLLSSGMTEESIKDKIQRSAEVCGLQSNNTEYPIGTVIPFSGNSRITFFLLALSQFNSDGMAECSIEDLTTAITSLLSFYDKRSQGNKMVVPLMGTGLSRTGLSHKEVYRRMTRILELQTAKIHGEIEIVIFSKDSDKVSIFEL